MKRTIFPRLINGSVCEIAGSRYRAEFWSDRTYEFISVDEEIGAYHRQRRTEQQVSEAIKKGAIKGV